MKRQKKICYGILLVHIDVLIEYKMAFVCSCACIGVVYAERSTAAETLQKQRNQPQNSFVWWNSDDEQFCLVSSLFIAQKVAVSSVWFGNLWFLSILFDFFYIKLWWPFTVWIAFWNRYECVHCDDLVNYVDVSIYCCHLLFAADVAANKDAYTRIN